MKHARLRETQRMININLNIEYLDPEQCQISNIQMTRTKTFCNRFCCKHMYFAHRDLFCASCSGFRIFRSILK